MGAIVFAALALAYRTRPVFVPTNGPNDPVARYRTAVMTRLRLVGIGVPALIGLITGFVAQTYWDRVQLFIHGGSFGIADPQFGKDLGFYAFDLPFYRLVLGYLFWATFLAFIANLLGHYLFGGIRLTGRTGALSRSARIQLIALVGILMLLKAVAYWIGPLHAAEPQSRGQAVHRRRLHRHQRGAAGQADPDGDRGDLRGGGVLRNRVAGLAHSGDRCGAAAVEFADRGRRLAVGRRADQRETQCGAKGKRLHQPKYHGNQAGLRVDALTSSPTVITAATRRRTRSKSPPTGRPRRTSGLLDPTIVSPAFTQFQQGKNFYYFPDQLSIDRYNGPDGNLRDYVVAARELNPDRLIDNQRDWINRHFVYTHGNGFIASPANTVRGIANDPNQNGGYPEFLASVVGANGSVISPGPAPLDQPRVYFGPVIASTSDDYAIVGKNGNDREYDYETNTETKNYTYAGKGGVPIGNWLARAVFAAKFSERKLVFPNPIGADSKILFNRDPSERVKAVAPWLTTDTSVYPAIVNKRMVWIVDGYTTLDNYPYSQLMSLSSATADSTEVAVNRLAPDKMVSYIRNSVKATVDAYDGTVTLYAQDEKDPVLQAWMKVFPGTVKPKSDISPELQAHLRYPEDLFKVQRTSAGQVSRQ